MHENNIELLNLEAQRLLDLNIDLLQEMLNRPNVLEEQQTNDNTELFDRSRAKECIEQLQGERSKISRKEIVLAIVGTMKAGKSTTINAIVGKEILPNRNRPMTSLPTLIRHVPGKTTPELKLANLAPLMQLLVQLNKQIKTPEGQRICEELSKDSKKRSMLEIPKSTDWLKEDHHGEQEIYKFLANLNDVVRLANALNVEFPYSAYDEVDELPVIEVEFSHLSNVDTSQGTLTLLDTPGPNEAGQPHLHAMMRDQLKKASAVLAVLNYEQLESLADEDVRNEINAIADVASGRLFVLVNKFDQCDRNSDDAEAVRNNVPSMLRSGAVTPDRVYPGSANHAFLANSARASLSNAGSLPENARWVEDFLKLAFGQRWKRTDLSDKELILESANEVWLDSMFEQLINEVVHSAHAKAAALAVDSAASKLVQNAETTHEYLSLRHQGIVADIQTLQDQINGLLSDVEKITTCQKTVNHEVEDAKINISRETTALLRNVSNKLTSELDSLFEQGKDKEEEQELNSLASLHKGFLSSIFDALSGNTVEKKFVFDKHNPEIKFDSRSDAQNFANGIEQTVMGILQQAEREIKTPLTDIVSKIEKSFNGNAMKAVDEIARQINERLQDGGFSVKITFPKVENLRTSLSINSRMGEFLEEKSFSKTQHRRKDNLWGKVCGWFGTDDWGWEEYTETVQRTVIDMRKIRKVVSQQTEEHFTSLNGEIEHSITTPLVEKISEFFKEFKAKVEQLRNTLIKSKQDHESNKLVKEELTAHLLVLQQRTPELLLDSKALKVDLEPMLK